MFSRNCGSILTVLIVAVALGHAGTTYADGDFNQLLKGDYAFSQAETCVITSSEAPVVPTFDAATLQLLGDAEVQTLQTRGISSFDGAGNWSSVGTGIGLSLGQTQAGDFPVSAPPVGAPSDDISCEGTYSVSADRSVVLEYSCEVPSLGVGSGPRVLHAHISGDRKTLIFADTEPVIEEIRILGTNIVVAERVCTAVATDARLL